jgi:hypothetical protein
MKNFYFFVSFVLFSFQKIHSQQVVINEIQSSNWGIIYANGELEDWIELKNKTNASIDLSKFYLSDDRKNLKMWRFPTGTTISAQGFLLVFASGKNKTIASKIHTNFSLSSSNSDVFFSDTSGKLIDFHVASGITSKTSWARVPDGANSWCILGVPSPGATNGNGSCITQFAPPPIVSIKPGIYNGRVTLTVTCPDTGTFKYTTDGKTPSITVGTSKSSGSSVFFDSSCVLKIRTYKTGKHPSTLWVGTYLIKQPANISMPIVSISMNPDSFTFLYNNVDKVNEKEGYVQYLDKKGNLLTQFGANFTIHGNYSSSFPQKSLRVETRQWLDSSTINYKLYQKDIYKFRNFNLRNAGVDWMRGHVRDAITSNLARKTNADYGDVKQVLGYINGKYTGIFEIREKYDNDFCAENHNVNADSIDMLSYGGTVNYGKDSAWLAMSNLANTLNLVQDSNFNKVAKYIDLDNWIDYFSTEMYIANTDWPGNNIKWWRPQRTDGKWRYILWDLDFGWGLPWGGGGGIAVTTDLLSNVMGGGLVIGDLMNNINFRKKFINRYADLMNTIFRYENVPNYPNVFYYMKSNYDTLDKEMPRAFTRWPNPGGSVSGAATNYSDWKSMYQNMYIWAKDRPKYARGHIKSYYNSMISDTVNITITVSPSAGGRIKINTIYPTIGSGWKGTYFKGVPVTLTAIPNPGYKFVQWNVNNNDTNLTTSKDFTAMQTVIGYFTPVSPIEQPKLAFTEINYNSNKTLNSGNWVELKNYGNSDVYMTGYCLTAKTIWKKYIFKDNYVIKAGGYVVLCSDTSSFYKLNSRSIKTILLPFDLDNNTEILELKDPSEKLMLSMEWINNNPWPMTADGHGRSMELISDTANPSNPLNWFNGCMGGSPGKTYTPCNEPFSVSEINYNSPTFSDAGDWIELYNHRTDTVKLGGWKLNDKDVWNQWVFPANFKLAPGERRIICGDTAKFNTVHPGVASLYLPGFNLKNNEDVLEFYNSKDSIKFSVAYADTFPFTFKADGKGFTLDLKDSVLDMSSGSSWRAVCMLGSPSITSAACEGGIIISEVNFKSASFNDAGDWFEIHNTNSSTFNLSNWKLTDDTTNFIYTIPTGISLPPFGYLVFVSDTVKFKKMYPWVKNYVGNFSFGLGSKSDAIKIYNPQGDLVNAMKYDDIAPWPSAIAGRGFTMELTDSDAWLNDGSKWRKSGCWGGSPGEALKNCNDSIWISEINYNSETRTDADDWVEFWNNGSKDVNISNWMFSDANLKDTFFFPQNTILKTKERIVVSANLSKLFAIHDTVRNALGVMKFGLGSASEQIVLRDTSFHLKFGMEYNTDSTWSKLPNGNGYTLSLIKNKSDFINPTSWTNACPSGSPGKADGPCNVVLTFSEINYSSEPSLNTGDWVEVVNIGKIPADLSYFRFQGNTISDYWVLPKTKLIYPNERVVLVNDSNKFKSFNPNIANRFGNFSFDLSQDTSFIYMIDPYNIIVTKAFYSSKSGWAQGAFGQGKTLERNSFKSNSIISTSWFDGCIGGSPGSTFSKCNNNPVVSEINYNPAIFFNTGKWFELHNTSITDTLDIGGYTIRSSQFFNAFNVPTGVKLMPNERIVVTADSTKFKSYYSGVKFLGNFIFSMNFNEKIRIFDKAGKIVFTTDYSNNIGWPQKANGQGNTLELIDSAYLYSSPTSWFDGCFGGSPGSEYQPCNTQLKISEINYQSNALKNSGDWLELYNTSSSYVNLQGLKIVNKDSTLISTISRPYILNPKSFIVLCNDSFKFDFQYSNIPRINDLFILNDTGESIKIYDANVLLTEATYSSKSPWLPGADGLGHTNERKSINNNPNDANSWFIGCIGGSPGYAFTPCTETIVISEVNYASHPKADAGDWLEIYNKSNDTIDISSWRLTSRDNLRVHFVKNGTQLYPKQRYILYSDQTKYVKIFGALPMMGEKIIFNLQPQDIFSIINNQSKLLYSNGWDSISNWPNVNQTSYTLESKDSVFGYFDSNNWILGCPSGSPETELKDCDGVLSVTELNPSSEGWYQTGDWIELANLSSLPFNPIDFEIKTQKATGLSYKIKSNTVLFKGDRVLIVNDSLRFILNTGISNFESPLPFGFDDKQDSVYIYNRKGIKVYASLFSSNELNMKDAYLTGRTLEVNENTNTQMSSSWYAGCIGGTPGTAHLPCVFDVTINELNLLPASTVQTGRWFELKNKTNSSVNYQGYKLKTSSGDYLINAPLTIASNGYGIVAENIANFKTYWSNVSAAVGDNKNIPALKGRVALFDANENVKFYIDYDSVSPWPLYTTMPGRTLEMLDTATNPWDAKSWIAGCYAGTPGRGFSLPCEYYGLGITNSSSEKETNYIYPNPNTGLFTIHLMPDFSKSKIRIINSLGQKVTEIENNGKTEFSIEQYHLTAGIYMIQIDNGLLNQHIKMIKQ